MNTPLAMLVSGTAIAQTHIGKALRRPRMYWMLFLRLMPVPAVVIILLSFVPVPEEIRLVTAMGISAPTAAISTMFAVKYHRDVGYAQNCLRNQLYARLLPCCNDLFSTAAVLARRSHLQSDKERLRHIPFAGIVTAVSFFFAEK